MAMPGMVGCGERCWDVDCISRSYKIYGCHVECSKQEFNMFHSLEESMQEDVDFDKMEQVQVEVEPIKSIDTKFKWTAEQLNFLIEKIRQIGLVNKAISRVDWSKIASDLKDKFHFSFQDDQCRMKYRRMCEQANISPDSFLLHTNVVLVPHTKNCPWKMKVID